MGSLGPDCLHVNKTFTCSLTVLIQAPDSVIFHLLYLVIFHTTDGQAG